MVWSHTTFANIAAMFRASRTLLWLTLLAIAMANVEAVVVIHLRSLYNPDRPLEIFPLNILSHRDLLFEWGRETATVVMILAVALLLPEGEAAFQGYQPGEFPWSLYLAGYVLMTASLGMVARNTYATRA